MHQLKIYRGVMCNETEELWKIWRGIDLSCQDRQKQFDKFWFDHWKVSKIYFLMGGFWLKYVIFELKKYRGVIFHDAREWCKFKEKVTCGLKNDMKNLANFHQTTQKSQNWGFYGVLLSKVENVWA